jgi:hypothetical protein
LALVGEEIEVVDFGLPDVNDELSGLGAATAGLAQYFVEFS